MPRAIGFIGALLSAALLLSEIPSAADPQLRNGELSWFLLTETKDTRWFLGNPRGRLSVLRGTMSRNEMSMRYFPRRKPPCTIIRTQKSRFSLRLRCLPEGRVLMAMGTSKPGQLTGQLVLMRESELRFFYPWVSQQLELVGQVGNLRPIVNRPLSAFASSQAGRLTIGRAHFGSRR